MRILAAFAPFLVLVLTGCDRDESVPPPDAATGVRVTGCDDPAVWTAPALEPARLGTVVGGGPCSPAQYPLHRVELRSLADRLVPVDERDQLRTCWRVTEASPGSGWSAGQEFTSEGDGAAMNVMGFARSVTVEGRVLRADGTVAFSIAPGTIALDEARILEPTAGAVIAVMSREAWAEGDAVHLWGERVPTDPVLDGTALPFGSYPFTLHRTAAGLVLRSWWRNMGEIEHVDVLLGPGARARLAKFARAIVVDDELLLLGSDGDATVVRSRIPLGAEPLEVVGNYYYVTLHMDGALVRYDYATGTARSLAVGDGVLLPPDGDRFPIFFDGTAFRGLVASTDSLAFDDRGSFSPRTDDLAALGAPAAVLHGIVFGEHGLLADVDAANALPGPRFAPYSELFGEGHLGPVAVDTAAYVIARSDGTAAIYEAPFIDWCDVRPPEDDGGALPSR